MFLKSITFTLLTWAGTFAATDSHEFLSLLKVSGDTALINMSYNILVEVQDPVKQTIGEDLAAKLQPRLAEAPADLFQTSVSTAFQKAPNDASLKACNTFFATPLYKKLKKAEEASETEQGQKQFAVFMETIEQQGITPARQTLINDLVIKTGVLGLVLTMFDLGLEAQLRAANGNGILPVKKSLSDKTIKKIVADNRKATGRDIQMSLTSNLLYTYKSFTEEEIRTYMAFLSSKDGKWYQQILLDGMDLGFKAGGQLALPKK